MKKSGLFKQLGFAALVAAAGVCTWGWASARSGSSSPEGAAALRSDEGVVIIDESFTEKFPSGWITKDPDGDGKTFQRTEWQNHGVGTAPDLDFSGNKKRGSATSSSFPGPSGKALDTWLITPRLNLPNGGKVSYWVATYASYAPAEQYSVYYSTTGTSTDNFTLLKNETLSSAMVWANHILDLPTGTKYVAFRHHDCKQNAINFDDIKITGVERRCA